MDISGSNPPPSAEGPPSAAVNARATNNLKRSVQAAFDGIVLSAVHIWLFVLQAPSIISCFASSQLSLAYLCIKYELNLINRTQ